MTAAPDGSGALTAERDAGPPRGPGPSAEVAVVVIGRNEGERLRRCLQALAGRAGPVVYVDSGSTDGSVAAARGMGVEVVELDMTRPFTAARARNAGLARLLGGGAAPDLVQFVDGDVELDPGWIGAARAFLAAHPEVAVVAGRLRERHPEASLWNRLCDIEWDAPVGEAEGCGGIFLARRGALAAVGGFNEALIAGEEPDLCWRLRRAGWRIHRIAAEMGLHDAAMTRFGQWWRRNARSGHATAEALDLRGGWSDRAARRPVLSNVLWALPVLWPLWPLLWWRVWRTRRDAAHATFIVLGKLPHLQGQLRYWRRRRRGDVPRLIEYK